MRLTCFECGKSVSTEVPDDTTVRAWLICPECVELADETALNIALGSIRMARQRLQMDSGTKES